MARSEVAEGKEAAYLQSRIWVETLPIWLKGNPGMETYRSKTLAFERSPAAADAYWETWVEPYLRPEFVRPQLLRLQERGIPALLVWGKDDGMGDAPCAMGTYAEGTGAQLLEMDNAGHCCFADHPDLFFDTVNAFLRAL